MARCFLFALGYYSIHSGELFALFRVITMLKGLIICFVVLFAQLAVLKVIDARLYNAQDVRQVVSTVTTPHKEDEEDDSEAPLL